MATKKTLPVGDQTRTAQAVAHLERLQEAKGKRLVVDLDASGREALEKLLESDRSNLRLQLSSSTRWPSDR